MQIMKRHHNQDRNGLRPFWFFDHDDGHHSLVDRLFKNFLDSEFGSFYPMKRFPIDIDEDERNYYIKAALPGFDKNNIELELDQNMLTIKAFSKKEDKGKNANASYQSHVTRSISIPEGTTPDKISAKHENGVLIISIPKVEGKKPNKIAIQ